MDYAKELSASDDHTKRRILRDNCVALLGMRA